MCTCSVYFLTDPMTYYSTIQEIRDEAWFTGNTNITNDVIERYQKEAYAYIRSRIAAKYITTNLVTSNAVFHWSDAHKFLKRVEELFAAWRLLIKEYGPDGTEEKEQWEIRVDRWEEKIDSLFRDEFAARLIDNNGNEFPSATYSRAWWPVATGMIGVPNKFTLDQIF